MHQHRRCVVLMPTPRITNVSSATWNAIGKIRLALAPIWQAK